MKGSGGDKLRFSLRELKNRCIQSRIFDLSAQLAYYFLLSLFPFLLLLVTLLAYLPFHSQDILLFLKPFTPNESFQLIKGNLNHLFDLRRGEILSISLISTIYPASLAFQSIIRTLNHAYEHRYHRPLWKNIVLGTCFMMGIFFALILSLLLAVFGRIIGEWLIYFFGLTKWYSTIWDIMRWGISTVILAFIFFCIYTFVPSVRITFRDAIPGTIFATFGWQISSFAFSTYVNLDHYSLIYGNLGAVIILLGWFYLTAFILILGGQVNAVWKESSASQ